MQLTPLLTLVKESLVYGLSSIIARSISILLVPIYTRIFTPHDYGIIGMVQAMVGFLSLFLGLGAEASIGVFFYDRNEPGSRRRLIANYILLQLMSALMLGGFLCLFREALAKQFLEATSNALYLGYGAGILLLSSLNGVMFNLFRFFRKPVTLMVLNTITSLLQVGAAFVLVVILRMGVSGSLLGQMIGYGVGFVAGAILLREWISLREFSSGEMKGLIRLGVPYMISAVLVWSIGSSNRFFLEHYLSLTEVGLFSLASSLAQGFGLITGAFQMAFGPYAMSIKDKEDARTTYRNILTAFLAVGFGIGAAFSILAPEIILLLATPVYLPAAKAIPFLILYLLSVSLGYIASTGSWIAKRTENLFLPTLTGGIVNVLGNLLLIKPFGIAGAALATVLGQGVYVAYLFYLSQRSYPIPYRFRELWICLGLYGACVAGGYLVDLPNLSLALLWKFLLILFFFAGIVLFRVVPGEKLKELLETLPHALRTK